MGTVKTQTTRENVNLEGLEIGVLNASEVAQAIAVAARGMRDNPLHIAAFGQDAERRYQRIHRLFQLAFSEKGLENRMLAARTADGVIVGVCGMLPPGDCLPSPSEKLRMLPKMLTIGLGSSSRVMRWLGAWAARDPQERHWHVGPVAVDPHLQGMGIGSQLMRVFAAQMDAAGEMAYLETDKAMNVTFYKRFGFEVVAEELVLGIPNWHMKRYPRSVK